MIIISLRYKFLFVSPAAELIFFRYDGELFVNELNVISAPLKYFFT